MSELSIQTAAQTTIRSMDAFADADVTINDWRVLDGSVANAPYVIIESADEFTSDQTVMTPDTRWTMKVWLFERFTEWKTTLDNFTTRRQAIIDEFNEVGSNRAAGGAAATDANPIRSGSAILPYYDPQTPANLIPESDPIYLYQLLLLDVREF